MAESGLCSGAPVKTVTGDDFFCDGELYFLLTKRIRGSEFDPDILFGPEGLQNARYLGSILGQLHNVLASLTDVVCNERDIYREVCDCWLAPSAEAMGLSPAFCEEYRSFGALHDSLPVQIIHRDPNPSNILMQEGTLAGFIDFDLTQRSIRLFDPCYASTAVLCGLFQKGQRERVSTWPEIFRQILQGYDEKAHLTDAERKAIPYVVLSIQLICVGWFSSYDRFHALAETNMDMLRWLLEIKEELTL
jgi:Ser/Thr protein kinase RdoA (MazF antagonist)